MSLHHHIAVVAMLVATSPFDRARAEEAPTPETVVTATRVERQVFETPQAITVLGDRAVEEANVSATPDLFRHAEGVYVQKTNQGGGSPFIRGLTGKQVLILIDGVRLNNSYYRFGPHQYLNTIDPNMIERIEVVRGPSSVLYGSDALGGTINIITRRRTDFSQPADLAGLAQVRYESAADASGLRLQAEGNSGELGAVGGATLRSYGDLEGGGDMGEQMPSAYDERDADLKLNWRLGDHTEIIFANQYVRQYDVPKTSEVTLGDKLKFNYEPQERLLSYIELRTGAAGPFDGMKLNVSYQRQREGEEIVARSAPTTETRELTDVGTVGTSLQFHNRLGDRQRLTYGVEYYHDAFDTSKRSVDLTTGTSTQTVPGTPDGATYGSLGAYVQDEIRVTPKSDVIVGVRYSRFESEGEAAGTALAFDADDVTASVNGLYRLTPSLNLVGGIAQGFRAPNMEDFFGRVDFVSEIPNTALEPEKSLTREIGLKYYTGRMAGDIYYFDTDYEGFIDRATVAPGVRQRQNIQDANIRGIEAALSYELSPRWLLAGTAAWTRGEDEDTGAPLRRIPPLNGTLRLRHSPSERTWWEFAGLFADRQDRLAPGDLTDPRIPPGGTPGYAVFNLAGAWRPARGHELLATIENLADKAYKTHGSGVFAPGRGLNLSYRVTFD